MNTSKKRILKLLSYLFIAIIIISSILITKNVLAKKELQYFEQIANGDLTAFNKYVNSEHEVPLKYVISFFNTIDDNLLKESQLLNDSLLITTDDTQLLDFFLNYGYEKQTEGKSDITYSIFRWLEKYSDELNENTIYDLAYLAIDNNDLEYAIEVLDKLPNDSDAQNLQKEIWLDLVTTNNSYIGEISPFGTYFLEYNNTYWEILPKYTTMTWHQAKEKCKDINLRDNSNWRMASHQDVIHLHLSDILSSGFFWLSNRKDNEAMYFFNSSLIPDYSYDSPYANAYGLYIREVER